MTRSLYAVLLAGRIRPSAFGDALDIPVVCLPIGQRGTLLDAWLAKLLTLPNLSGVRVVVNTPEQVRSAESAIDRSALQLGDGVTLDVVAEPASWRGAAGIVRDVTNHLPDDCAVLICEAKRLPPDNLSAIVDGVDDRATDRNVVGVCGSDEPAGVYLFSRRSISAAPAIGYFDLKEQFIPSLRERGVPINAASVGDCVRRVQDLESYLECVRFSLETRGDQMRHRIADQAFIASTAVLSGRCIIEAGAVVDERAVVHDSVVLWGATVGEGAVVNRCVIGSSAIVPERARIARTVIAARDRGGLWQPAFELAVPREFH